MELSICIPVFNFDVSDLVHDLNKEIKDNNIDAEIILIDDASDYSFIQVNKLLQDKVQRLVFLDKNIGRSKIRNLFLKYSHGKYLLFLDCDVKIDNKNFLYNYMSVIRKEPDIGLIYGNFKISDQEKTSLRNRYSLEREIFTGNRAANFSVFKTVNFVIRKDIFEKFPFNEELTQYGYEDFIFAKLLEQNRVTFLAINNPVIHFDCTSNEVFLQKTEISIDSLLMLSKSPQNREFIKGIKVYRAAAVLKQLRLASVFLFFYNIFEKRIKRNLTSGNPNIRFFDLYKLALLIGKINSSDE
ncbi:glycosyltransferase family 2 protein [Chryseobacterium flavum]|uniref:glycosyltransferase family 2 protein n=1 Tax=Chryseobacterium flavum TaxID=415851 RepID=UPI0028A966D0|nr:glycosyltransferase family 2 protein [Chryseobacterium flavum]